MRNSFLFAVLLLGAGAYDGLAQSGPVGYWSFDTAYISGSTALD